MDFALESDLGLDLGMGLDLGVDLGVESSLGLDLGVESSLGLDVGLESSLRLDLGLESGLRLDLALDLGLGLDLWDWMSGFGQELVGPGPGFGVQAYDARLRASRCRVLGITLTDAAWKRRNLHLKHGAFAFGAIECELSLHLLQVGPGHSYVCRMLV